MIEIILQDGCCPRTRKVLLENASAHIVAGDRLADEAKALLAFLELEELEKDPTGFDPASGDLVFEDSDREGIIPVKVIA